MLTSFSRPAVHDSRACPPPCNGTVHPSTCTRMAGTVPTCVAAVRTGPCSGRGRLCGGRKGAATLPHRARSRRRRRPLPGAGRLTARRRVWSPKTAAAITCPQSCAGITCGAEVHAGLNEKQLVEFAASACPPRRQPAVDSVRHLTLHRPARRRTSALSSAAPSGWRPIRRWMGTDVAQAAMALMGRCHQAPATAPSSTVQAVSHRHLQCGFYCSCCCRCCPCPGPSARDCDGLRMYQQANYHHACWGCWHVLAHIGVLIPRNAQAALHLSACAGDSLLRLLICARTAQASWASRTLCSATRGGSKALQQQMAHVCCRSRKTPGGDVCGSSLQRQHVWRLRC